MKTYRIYKIENTINSLLYVGYTTLPLERRMKAHIQTSRSTRPRHLKNPLYTAMRELGIENFHMCLLEEGELKRYDDLAPVYSREHFWMKRLNTISPNGYNRVDRRLSDTDVAIIRFNACKLADEQYAALYSIHPGSVKQIRLILSNRYMVYHHVTQDHLPEDIEAYMQQYRKS